MHDPQSADLRREASRKGGRARSNAARARAAIPQAMTAGELAGFLSLLFTNVMAGKIDPKIGTAAATIARILIEVQERADQPTVAELQIQLDTLRAMIERNGRGAA